MDLNKEQTIDILELEPESNVLIGCDSISIGSHSDCKPLRDGSMVSDCTIDIGSGAGSELTTGIRLPEELQWETPKPKKDNDLDLSILDHAINKIRGRISSNDYQYPVYTLKASDASLLPILTSIRDMLKKIDDRFDKVNHYNI